MKLFRILISAALVIALMPFTSRAQEQKSPEQQEKEMREAIDKELEKYSRMLDLDMAQEFILALVLS